MGLNVVVSIFGALSRAARLSNHDQICSDIIFIICVTLAKHVSMYLIGHTVARNVAIYLTQHALPKLKITRP